MDLSDIGENESRNSVSSPDCPSSVHKEVFWWKCLPVFMGVDDVTSSAFICCKNSFPEGVAAHRVLFQCVVNMQLRQHPMLSDLVNFSVNTSGSVLCDSHPNGNMQFDRWVWKEPQADLVPLRALAIVASSFPTLGLNVTWSFSSVDIVELAFTTSDVLTSKPFKAESIGAILWIPLTQTTHV